MMTGFPARDQTWSQLAQDHQVIVIGGGITGAGVFLLAARAGLKPLLLEGHDFASGTSSRSSKLVHGGLRYLRNGQLATTFHAVRERERLLEESAGLVKRLPFLFPVFKGDMPVWELGLGLAMFDLIAWNWQHQRLSPQAALEAVPALRERGLQGAYRYHDALTDDSRLVLRVIQGGIQAGGSALNYAVAGELLRRPGGRVQGVVVQDQVEPNRDPVELRCPLVINASGAWADEVRARIARPARLRPLRGSHLVFPRERLPLEMAVTVLHPHDQRPLFAIPWEGVTLFGTTDLDLGGRQTTNLRMSESEREYLDAALDYGFPSLGLQPQAAVSSYAGVRSVISSGARDPSKESREHAIWLEDGLLTVTGGKLTTFRLMAQQVLSKASPLLEVPIRPAGIDSSFKNLPRGEAPPGSLDRSGWDRLRARYGPLAGQVAGCSQAGELDCIAGLPTRWVELRWAARSEACLHLEDMMLRRTRLGLQLPEGGRALLPTVRGIVQADLGWSDRRWNEEERAYRRLWERYYAP